MTVSAQKTEFPHIAIDEHGVPIVLGKTIKVVELVLAHKAYGWSAEELHFQFPHVRLAEIYSALAYYCEHRDAIDKDLQVRNDRASGPPDASDQARFVDELRSRRSE